MTIVRSRPLAALIIRWPNAVPAFAAREISRQLMEHRLPATWSLDQLGQIEALASWGAVRSGAEAALHVPPAADAVGQAADDSAAGEISRRLVLMRASGMAVDVVHAGPHLTAGSWPRTLRALGVRGIVIDGRGQAASARALPFGVWQFSPQAVVPRKPRWWQWRPERKSPVVPAERGLPTVATIELAELGAPGSRPWREAEAVLRQALEARHAGLVNVVRMGEVTAHFTHAQAPRPQRSICAAA